MTDYISREAALNAIKFAELGEEYAVVELLPAADVRPVVRGEWVETIEQNGWEDVRCATCSACGDSYVLDEWGIDDLKGLFNFCPNCGADMRKEVQDG